MQHFMQHAEMFSIKEKCKAVGFVYRDDLQAIPYLDLTALNTL
jgi:hypothetical protein